MPKATSTTFTHVHGTGSSQNPHTLRRNQACHQCRKRKLKCDAKRPCSTCVRSHAYAVAHAPAGSKMPLYPECTFDAIPEITLEQHDPPKSRFERLEDRINELESILSEKAPDKVSSPSYSSPAVSDGPGLSHITSNLSSAHIDAAFPDPSISLPNIGSQLSDSMVDPMLSLGFPMPQNGSALDSLAEAAILANSPALSAEQSFLSSLSMAPSSAEQIRSVPSNSSSPDPVLDMISLGWPRNLPSPELVRHLADAYFSFNADGNRLFHRATFMASLALPPTHPKFPLTALLHAMCAMGSLYTAAVAPTPNPTSSPFPMDTIFDEKHRMSEQRPYSFAEIQAEYARQALDTSNELGDELLQGLQAEVLLSSWYWASAKWSKAYVSGCRSLRFCIPLGLNVGSPFYTISNSFRPPSIIPPSKSVEEDEMRRNTFWIAYSLERAMGCGHGWALMLDDQDVSQLLPLCSDQYENGVFVPPKERQWSHDRDVLLVHPVSQTDAFVLYVKSCILLSRVKNFNSRFRAKYYAGDPSTVTISFSTVSEIDSLEPKDIRNTPAFIELSQLISAFQSSFPTHFRSPVQDGIVNPHLFSACTAPLLACILLHETHAHIGSETCESSLKILNSARGILNLVYDVYATSYDLSLLGQFPVVSWFMAGRVLVRFLRAALDSELHELSASLQIEVNFLRNALSQVGQCLPLAHRYGKMLHEFICKNCGEQYGELRHTALPPRGIPLQTDNRVSPNTSDLVLNLQLDRDNLSRWDI